MKNVGNKGLWLPYHACMKLEAIKKPSGKLSGKSMGVNTAVIYDEFS